jgi:hypothetical protein
MREALYSVDEVTGWELLQSLAFETPPANIQTQSSPRKEAQEATCDLLIPVASLYRLSNKQRNSVAFRPQANYTD